MSHLQAIQQEMPRSAFGYVVLKLRRKNWTRDIDLKSVQSWLGKVPRELRESRDCVVTETKEREEEGGVSDDQCCQEVSEMIKRVF